MKMSVKRMTIAGSAVLALASVGGAAFAKTPAAGQNAPVPPSETTAGLDTDNIREGAQTAPDNGAEAARQTGGEQATETGGGSTAESDGLGGHEDPAGNVDHQFEGQE